MMINAAQKAVISIPVLLLLQYGHLEETLCPLGYHVYPQLWHMFCGLFVTRLLGIFLPGKFFWNWRIPF